jgi:hypothetical protein
MRYARDYEPGYGRGRGGEGGLRPPQDTNWMGRAYRSPDEPPRGPVGRDRASGAGYPPRHGARDAAWERGPRGAYDAPYRQRGDARHAQGYDAPYGARYDLPYRGGRGGYDGGAAGGYDRGYRGGYGAGGYDRGYRDAQGGYDAPYRRPAGPGGGAADPWGPYSAWRMLQGRSGGWGVRGWPNQYFTGHGHSTGPF